jgi:hypothetical protein
LALCIVMSISFACDLITQFKFAALKWKFEMRRACREREREHNLKPLESKSKWSQVNADWKWARTRDAFEASVGIISDTTCIANASALLGM